MFLLFALFVAALAVILAAVVAAFIHGYISHAADFLFAPSGPDPSYRHWFLRQDGRLERLLAETLVRAYERGFPVQTPRIFWRRRWLLTLHQEIATSLYDEQQPEGGLITIHERRVSSACDADLRIIIAHELAHLYLLRGTDHWFLRSLQGLDAEIVCNLFAAFLFGSQALLAAQQRCGISSYGFPIGELVQLRRSPGPPVRS